MGRKAGKMQLGFLTGQCGCHGVSNVAFSFGGGSVLAAAWVFHGFYIITGLFHPCRMCTERIQPDIISYGSITHACGASGQWERALGIFQELRALGGKRS